MPTYLQNSDIKEIAWHKHPSRNGWNIWSMDGKSIITDYTNFTREEEGNNPPAKWIGHFMEGFTEQLGALR